MNACGPQGCALVAAHGAEIGGLKERLVRIEDKLDAGNTWLVTTLVTALLSALMLIFTLLCAPPGPAAPIAKASPASISIPTAAIAHR